VYKVPDNVWQALGDSAVETAQWAAATYGGKNVRLDLDSSGDLTWQGDAAAAQASGSIRAYGYGDSLVPTTDGALLACRGGQELIVNRDVIVDGSPYTIPLAVMRITGNDGGKWASRLGYSTGWSVGLTVADRLRKIARAKVLNPANPQSTSMWTELQRLALMPIDQQGIPDKTVSSSIGYDDRPTAVANLAALAAGVPSMTRQGALTIRQTDRWATVTDAEFNISGTITWDDEQSDDFYNYVWAHSPDGQFNGFWSFTDDTDPRSINNAGPVTYEQSSPIYTSDSACTTGAATIGDRLLHRSSRTVTVTVGAQGLCLDLGDVGWVRDTDKDRAVLGEVSRINLSGNVTQPIELDLIVAQEG